MTFTLPFCDRFDADLAASGPAAVFTVDAGGELRLDVHRTRDARSRVEGTPHIEPCHCLFRDRATGWVQYVLVTSPALCAAHPRADVTRYPDQASALAALAALGCPPLAPPAAAGACPPA